MTACVFCGDSREVIYPLPDMAVCRSCANRAPCDGFCSVGMRCAHGTRWVRTFQWNRKDGKPDMIWSHMIPGLVPKGCSIGYVYSS